MQCHSEEPRGDEESQEILRFAQDDRLILMTLGACPSRRYSINYKEKYGELVIIYEFAVIFCNYLGCPARDGAQPMAGTEF